MVLFLSQPLGEVFARQIKKFHENTERDKLEHADDSEPMASQSGVSWKYIYKYSSVLPDYFFIFFV